MRARVAARARLAVRGDDDGSGGVTVVVCDGGKGAVSVRGG